MIENDDTVPILDGNTLTYGEHQYTLEEDETTARVVFTHFPATIREFETLQKQLLGESRPGTLALELMAFEMYRRNRTKGEECIKKCTISAQAKSAISNLGQKFPLHRGDEITDSYQQPYLIASFLKGATESNKFQPDYPYQLDFTLSDSVYDKQGEYSHIYWGSIYYYNTYRNGDKQVKASVIVLDDDPIVMVHNCPSYYFATTTIKSWEDTLK